MADRRVLDDDLAMDFSGILAAIWQAKGRIFLISAIAAAGVFALSNVMSPRYKADAEVLIEPRQIQISALADSTGSSDVERKRAELDEQGVATTAKLIASRDNVLQVIETLKLGELQEFNPDPGLVSGIMATLGLAEDTRTGETDRILKNFMEKLKVSPDDSSRVVTVEFKSKSRELSQKVPNTLVDVFLKPNARSRLAPTEETAEVLKKAIDNLRTELRKADLAVADFRASANLEVTGGPDRTSIAQQQLTDISTQLGTVRSEKASALAKASEIRRILGNGGSVETVADVQASPLIQRLVERQSAIRAQIAELSSSLLPGHPRIQSLRAQARDLNAAIAEQARKIVTGLENDVRILTKNEEELTAEFNRLRATARQAEEGNVTLSQLESEAQAKRELLATYQARYNEALATTRQQYTPVNARRISAAVLPAEPYFPRKIPMTVAAFIGTAVLAILWILAMQILSGAALRRVESAADNADSRRLSRSEAELEDIIAGIDTADHEPEADDKSPEHDEHDDHDDIGEQPDVKEPAIASDSASQKNTKNKDTMPDNQQAANDTGTYEDDAMLRDYREFETAGGVGPHQDASIMREAASAFAAQTTQQQPYENSAPPVEIEIFTPRELATMLAFDGNRRVIAVSPQGKPGAMGCVALARDLAGAGHNTVLVDISGNGFSGETMTGSDNLPGVTDLLAGQAGFGDIVHCDHHSQAHIVPFGTALGTAMGSVGRLSMVLDALQSNYAFVIVDCGQTTGQGAARAACENAVALVSAVDAPTALLSDTIVDLQTAGFQSVPVLDAKSSQSPVPATSLLDRMAG